MVLVPFREDLPWVRVDMPTTATDRERLWDEGLREALAMHARRANGSARMAVLCFTIDRENAEVTSRDMGQRLAEIGVGVPVRLWTNDAVWAEFNTADSGRCSEDAVDRMTTIGVYEGRVRPAMRREAVAASMVGDREPVAALLKHALDVTGATNMTRVGTQQLVADRLTQDRSEQPVGVAAEGGPVNRGGGVPLPHQVRCDVTQGDRCEPGKEPPVQQ